MGGQPILRALHTKLIEAGRVAGMAPTDDGEAEAIYAVCMALRDGMSLTKYATSLDVSRGLLYTWLEKKGRRAAVQEARSVGAWAQVDDAEQILEDASPVTIGRDRERARVKLWIAERTNRADLGEQKVAPAISIGVLHIAALEAAAAQPAKIEPMEDVEVLTSGE